VIAVRRARETSSKEPVGMTIIELSYSLVKNRTKYAPALIRIPVISSGFSRRSGWLPHGFAATLCPASTMIHLTLGSRVFKNFTAIYATNQTDWNQSDFW
jgi:hypothetical protein